ncbi:hypothetical protein [Streptosporangium pseudovulgare]|uniref:Uncharacterized protein n=1 Tax=Streptosporangium pseudovulgare TaxID=35765 RepID=A0ABQ2RKE4_9ACTN|nr:hypothetical protein [Streptosporangium pseudovulgare]GGQ31589.1 hypothetical protein GCM10010140_72210 [Streptosporangium pseudovulgare]
MTTFRISPAVADAFPDTPIAVVAATRDGHLPKTAADDLQTPLQPHCEKSAVHHLCPSHPGTTA